MTSAIDVGSRFSNGFAEVLTTNVLSTQSTLWRHTAIRLPSKVMLGEKEAPWPELSDKNVKLGVQAHRATIKVLNKQIETIEPTILKHLKPIPEGNPPPIFSCS